MKVLIAGYFLFPTGSASAARIRNFALGFQECGAGVHVVAMAPPSESVQCNQLAGYPPVTYENVALFTIGQIGRPHPVYAAGRRLRWFAGLYGATLPAYRRVEQQIRNHQCDLFVAYGRNAVILAPLVRLCQRQGIPTVLDITEIPDQFTGAGGALSPIYWDWRLGARWLPQRFDTLSVITHGLKERYARLGCQHILVIPSIEGWADLPPVNPPTDDGTFRLVYVGALIERDAPELLVAALRMLRARGVPVVLDVVGRFAAYAHGRRMAEEIQADAELRTCVNLVGVVSDEELVSRLRDADGLILMRRDAPAEVNAFPTRLVEYLKQGRPVFVSDVGDIRCYLRHQIDAMLLSPTDAVHVANAIQQVAESPDRGYALGLQGRARGAAMFDRRIHVCRLLDSLVEPAVLSA